MIGLRNSQMARVTGSGMPLPPSDGYYGMDDESGTKDAVAMAESYGCVLLETSILKNRLRGNVGKVVPLMMSPTGRIVQLPVVAGTMVVGSKTTAKTTGGVIPMKGRR